MNNSSVLWSSSRYAVILLIFQLALLGAATASVPPGLQSDFSTYELYSPDSDITEPKVIEESRPRISLPLPEKAASSTVLVFELFIDSTGRVRGVYIHRGFDWRLTPEYAASMFHWVFEPATKGGKAISVRYVMTVRR